MTKISLKNAKIAIVGLGYVGLPLAVEFGKNRAVLGYDINQNRVSQGKKDVLRHNYKNIDWCVADASKAEYPTYNKILIDAPCSGTGVIGRRPDIK